MREFMLFGARLDLISRPIIFVPFADKALTKLSRLANSTNAIPRGRPSSPILIMTSLTSQPPL